MSAIIIHVDSATPYEPELGQMLFGNAAGEFDLGSNESYVADRLYELSKTLGERDPEAQHHGLLGGEWGYGQDFSNGVFEMHPYWWGDCTCGFDMEEFEWARSRGHAPQCFQTRYWAESERLNDEEMDFDARHGALTTWAKANGYPEAPYGEALYCDCGYDEEYVTWRQDHDHSPECPEVCPNFRCGNLEIRWYKYCSRGLSANRVTNRKELKAIFKRCFDSLSTADKSV